MNKQEFLKHLEKELDVFSKFEQDTQVVNIVKYQILLFYRDNVPEEFDIPKESEELFLLELRKNLIEAFNNIQGETSSLQEELNKLNNINNSQDQYE
jgi:hypothetical protein